MLGYSHATSGALVWLCVAPTAAGLIGHQVGLPELAVGAVACAGAALIPDLDHPQATIAHTFGPLSQGAARLTNLLAGGHRQGTHSLLFALGFGVFAQAIGLFGQKPSMVLMFMLAAFALRGLHLVPRRTPHSLRGLLVLVEAGLLTYGMTQVMPESWWWLGIACFIGCVTHLLGDALTPERVPFFYPYRGRYGIPIIDHTGNLVEKMLIGPALTIGVVAMAVLRYSQATGVSIPFLHS